MKMETLRIFKNSLFAAFAILCFVTVPRAQEARLEMLRLVDLPTAGTMDRGSYVSSLRLYPYGGVLGELQIGLSDRFFLGVSFGGENIIGEGRINWNPEPGLQFRLRIVDETFALPAIAIGFNSQGYGPYLKPQKRYTVKSRGFYAVASKNYAFLGDLSFHGGINYSLEKEDGDADLNFFGGIIKSLNPELNLVAEYDFALNDNDIASVGRGRGYLNVGIRWLFARRLSLQFQIKNILQNKENIPYSNREIIISYLEHF